MDIHKSTFKVLSGRLSTTILTFGSIAVFANILGPTTMGIFFLFQMMIGFISIPASFGRGDALVKRLSEQDSSGNFLGTGLVFLIITSIVLFPFILLFGNHINNYIGTDVALLLAVGTVLRSLYIFPKNILKGELRVGEIAILDVLRKTLWVGSSVAFIVGGFDNLALIYGLLVSYIPVTIWGIYKISIPFKRPTWKCAKSLIDYWKFTVFSFVDSTIYSWADIAIIGFFLTQADVAVYEIAWRVTVATVLLTKAIETSIFPQISAWDGEGSTEQIQSLLPKALTGSIFFVVPAFFGSLVLSDHILSFIFGSEYSQGALVLIILMGGKMIESINQILKTTLSGMNHPNLRMRASLISMFLNIALNCALVYEFGIVGAAVATTFSFTINTILVAIYLSNIVSIPVSISNIAWLFSSSLVMALLVSIYQMNGEISSLIELLVVILCGAGVYFGLVLMHSSLRSQIWKTVSRAFD